jgi:cytochrome c biogenesis protein CcmG, thiol:disulfide interchange protein DsbE
VSRAADGSGRTGLAPPSAEPTDARSGLPAGPGGAGRRATLRRRRPRTALVAAAVVALVVAALVAVLATRPPASTTEAASPLLGKLAPPLSGTSLTGTPVNLAALRGQFVVVNFFASWCPPCQVEEPELIQFAYQHHTAGDAQVLGVVFEDASASAARFLSTTGSSWQAVPDPGGQIALDYGVRGPPETFVIAPDGLVVARLLGAVTATDLDQVLARARAEGA